MSEIIHLPGQAQESSIQSLNPFEAQIQVVDADIYGNCQIDKPWEKMADLERNVAALPDSTHQIIFGISLQEADKSAEQSSKLIEFFKAIRGLTSKERAENSLKKNSFEDNKDILSFAIEQYLSRTEFFNPLFSFTLKKYWSERIKKGTTVDELSQEVVDWMNSMWDQGQAPFYSATEAKEIYNGYKEEYKTSITEIREREKQKSELSREMWALAASKRRQRADLERKIQALYADPRQKEREGLGKESGYKASDWQKVIDDAEYIETLFRGIKSRMTQEDFADIWMRSARRFEADKFNRQNNDSQLSDIFLQGIISWLEDTNKEGIPQENNEEAKRRLEKKINILKEQFVNLYNYLKRAKRDDTSMAASIQHSQQVLRMLLKAMEELTKLS